MEVLNLPTYQFRIKEENGSKYILDRCRNRFVKLTPEEWVRQNMVEYLIKEKQYPAGLIMNEATVDVNSMHKRCDTVIYNRDMTPQVIAEYKAPSVKITQKVFDQIAMYNMKLNVKFLIVSNGLSHYCCEVINDGKEIKFLQDIPTYQTEQESK